MSIGISSIGIAIPSLALPLSELARIRNIDPDKYLKGLACQEMSLCSHEENVVTLAVEAAKKALANYSKDASNIGLLAVGSESAVDMSRPLSAWVSEGLGLSGAIRSYEIKHACYGGMVALRQALEWKLANPKNKKAALVIAADVALYSQEDPGEPTQGAGAVAFVIDDAVIAEIAAQSYTYSEPVFDFWRPVGEDYPQVDGPFSLECYIKATKSCFEQFFADHNIDLQKAVQSYKALSFHVPFPKMVKKAFLALAETHHLDKAVEIYDQQVSPYMAWNQKTGNLYTASLWLTVANVLAKVSNGDKFLAFSYGSGCGSELIELTATLIENERYWAKDFEQQLANRSMITGEDYVELRKNQVVYLPISRVQNF